MPAFGRGANFVRNIFIDDLACSCYHKITFAKVKRSCDNIERNDG